MRLRLHSPLPPNFNVADNNRLLSAKIFIENAQNLELHVSIDFYPTLTLGDWGKPLLRCHCMGVFYENTGTWWHATFSPLIRYVFKSRSLLGWGARSDKMLDPIRRLFAWTSTDSFWRYLELSRAILSHVQLFNAVESYFDPSEVIWRYSEPFSGDIWSYPEQTMQIHETCTLTRCKLEAN